jgi:hypothetical protein
MYGVTVMVEGFASVTFSKNKPLLYAQPGPDASGNMNGHVAPTGVTFNFTYWIKFINSVKRSVRYFPRIVGR